MRQQFTKETWRHGRWPNFPFSEFVCSETGICYIDTAFMDRLQELRFSLGKPLIITSGYRDSRHSIERAKDKPGSHTYGKAADIKCSGPWAHEVLRQLMAYGFSGIGIKQNGPHKGRFIHADMLTEEDNFHAPRSSIWSY
jgi:zinc D-Ala-D-Ala carboxypeptidase